MSAISIPRWASALILGAVIVLLFLVGYRILNPQRAAGRENPVELQQTQAAERPGDPPSGATTPKEPPPESAAE